jgi:hypothetical protein
MLADLRADSGRWRQEQRATGTRGSHSPVLFESSGFTVPDSVLAPYVGSDTYHASTAGRQPDRRHGDSPAVDGPSYGAPPSRERERERERDRMPTTRMPVDTRMAADRMDIDPPTAQPERRFGQPERGYPPDARAYPPDSRAYPADSRAYPSEARPSYAQDQPMPSAYGRPPVTSSYTQEPRYAPSYPSNNDGAPPGYVRQGNYYVPVSTYEAPPAMAPSRSEPPQFPNGPYGQPSAPPRDTRDTRYGQPDYSDPRYAYPSPATTTVSVSGRDRDPLTSPPQPRFAH